jgi:hypothetical protein
MLAKHVEYRAEVERLFPARTSRENKPFQCPVPACPSGFHRLGDLTRHLRQRHTDAEDTVSTTPPGFTLDDMAAVPMTPQDTSDSGTPWD